MIHLKGSGYAKIGNNLICKKKTKFLNCMTKTNAFNYNA